MLDLVGKPEDRFSCTMAQIIINYSIPLNIGIALIYNNGYPNTKIEFKVFQNLDPDFYPYLALIKIATELFNFDPVV